jgi:hypothetical protein
MSSLFSSILIPAQAPAPAAAADQQPAPALPTHKSHRVLSCGMRGDDVKELQTILNEVMTPTAHLDVDGLFGYHTELEVLRFQTHHRLRPDGIVGPLTWYALEEAAGPPPSCTGKQAGGQGEGEGSGGPTPVIVKPAPKPIPHGNVARGIELVQRGGKLVPHFWQANPQWGYSSVGNGREMAFIGCAVTSIAMVLRYFGKNLDPGMLNNWLGKNGGYCGSAVVWHQAFQAHPNEGQKLIIKDTMYRERSNFRKILYHRIKNHIPTLVDVDYGRDRDTEGNHYVVVVGRRPDGSLIMNDPATPSGNGAIHWRDKYNIIDKTQRGGG